MSNLTHRFAALFALAAVVFTIGSARAEAQVFYVDAASTSPAAPYATPETAATTIADALEAARTAVVTAQSATSAEIRLKSGTTYTETGFTLDFPVAIVGDSGDPEDVEIVDAGAGSRAFTISHADAVVRDLTISGSGLNGGNGQGGHVWMSAGLVENCVIKDGMANNGMHATGYGGNVWMSGGRLSHSWITNGRGNGYNGNVFNSQGDGINVSGSGVVENCLIYANGTTAQNNPGYGLYATGSAKVINCSIINNTLRNVYIAANTVKIANSVIYGLGARDFDGSGNYKQCFSHCAASVTNDACATWAVLIDGFAGARPRWR